MAEEKAPTHDLPTGVSVKAETTFIRLVKEAFRRLDDFPLREKKGKTDREGAQGVYVGSEESGVDKEYLPQVRVTCGDASDYKGAINRLKDWEPNITEHTLVTQGYTMISCYSANDVEARDLAEYLKMIVLRARKDLGERGIFGVRDLKATKPKGVDAGAHQDGVYITRATFAFMIVENAEHKNVTDPFLRKISVDPEYEQESKTESPSLARVVDFDYEPLVELLFDKEVKPEYPTGFSVVEEGEEIPLTAVRGAFQKRRVRLELDRPPKRGSSVKVKYSPGNLTGDGGDVAGFSEVII